METIYSAVCEYIVKTSDEKLHDTIAQYAIKEFEANYQTWREISGYTEKFGIRAYILALTNYTNALYSLNQLNEDKLITIEKELLYAEREGEANAMYEFSLPEKLRELLSKCWNKLGKNYVVGAGYNYKCQFHEVFRNWPKRTDRVTCYAFRSCNVYLYQMLINEELNFSSPQTFNDPFDTPLINAISPHADLAELKKKALNESIKIACFSIASNAYSNRLMWAHYANSHKGICIEYEIEISKIVGQNTEHSALCYNEISYMDIKEMFQNNNNDIKDWLFVKNPEWEYEQEARLLYLDIKNNSPHVSLKIPHTIKSITFGVHCDDKDKQAITQILENKGVSFYQMTAPANLFGELKRETFSSEMMSHL